jgi:hypothetical protein
MTLLVTCGGSNLVATMIGGPENTWFETDLVIHGGIKQELGQNGLFKKSYINTKGCDVNRRRAGWKDL